MKLQNVCLVFTPVKKLAIFSNCSLLSLSPLPSFLPLSLLLPFVQLIHEIAEENGGVIISFPRAGSNSDKVVLKGARQCIDGAKARFKEIIEDLVGLSQIAR